MLKNKLSLPQFQRPAPLSLLPQLVLSSPHNLYLHIRHYGLGSSELRSSQASSDGLLFISIERKQMLNWISNTWAKFEAWVHGWFPGFKTYITTGLGVIGSMAATLQEYVTGLPITHYVTAETITTSSAVLLRL